MNKQQIQDAMAVNVAQLALLQAQFNQRKNQIDAQQAALQAQLDKLNAAVQPV